CQHGRGAMVARLSHQPDRGRSSRAPPRRRAGRAIRTQDHRLRHAGRRHAQISHGAARSADARIHGARARAMGGARPLPAQRPVALARLRPGRLAVPAGDFSPPRRHGRLGAHRQRDARAPARRRYARNPRPLRRQAKEASAVAADRLCLAGIKRVWRHCARTPAAFMTAAHLSRSRARKAANSGGEEILASTPSLTKALATSGDCRLALMSALSRLTIISGVPVGATTPVNETDVKSATPASIIVGTSGICERRRSLVEASALPCPPWPGGRAEAGFSNETCVPPATVAATDGPPPL